jgi:hypothetical protein
MTLPGADIQQHLYMSFLEGKTADVALRVHGCGSWYAIYKLHKVVLIQAVSDQVHVSILYLAPCSRLSSSLSSRPVFKSLLPDAIQLIQGSMRSTSHSMITTSLVLVGPSSHTQAIMSKLLS